MTKGRYDFVMGLGSACSCTQVLRACGLQLASFPLDWVSGADLAVRTDLVLSGFQDWFREEDFEQVENPGAFRHDSYRNKKTGLVYPHDFEQGQTLTASFPSVREKYARREARLLDRLRTSRRVLLVWIGDPRDASPVTDAQCAACRARFAAAFAPAEFDMVAVNCLRGQPTSVRESDKTMVIDADYASKAPDAKPWEIDSGLVQTVFRGFQVVDYRTPAEQRAFKQQERRREFERYAARNSFDCFCTKLRLKLYKHLRKCLLKRGVRLEEGV